MSMKTRICKLNKDIQNKIKDCLLHNGMTMEDLSYLWQTMTLKDILEYMDIEEVMT